MEALYTFPFTPFPKKVPIPPRHFIVYCSGFRDQRCVFRAQGLMVSKEGTNVEGIVAALLPTVDNHIRTPPHQKNTTCAS